MNIKKLNIITAVAVIVSVIACFALILLPKGSAKVADSNFEYPEKIFGTDMIEINIDIDKGAWQTLLDNATSESYAACDLTVNGTTYQSVGIRPKGNSSLSMVAGSDSDRFSFKFQFDEYIKGQTCFGLDKFIVNNMQADYTYMKEYISYYLMNYMSVDAPLVKYAHITVNGEEWGLYLAVECYEESFMERMYNTSDGNLYSVKTAMGRGKEEAFGGRQPGSMGNISGADGGGNLAYSDDNSSSYSSIFDNTVLNTTGEEDYQRIIAALKKLSEDNEIDKYFDVDQILRYFAVHTTVVNLDSYISNMQQNYYLYENDGKVTILPWDYNLAFGGFQSGNASSAVNFPVDTPVSGVELSERPLIAKLLEVDEYKEKYHEYLQEVAQYLNSNEFETQVQDINSLIYDYVKNDATAFCTIDQYKSAIETFTQFCRLRAESILGQLSGKIPSTTSGQKDAAELVDAGVLNLSSMGSQGGGGNMGKPGGAGGFGQMPANADGYMQMPGNMGGYMQMPADKGTTDGQSGMEDTGVQNRGKGFPGKGFGKDGTTQGMQLPNQDNGNFGNQGRRMNMQNSQTGNLSGNSGLLWLGISALVLLAGIGFAVFYKRRVDVR